MSESKARAESIAEVAPGLWHWNVDDERIGGYIGSSHAVVTDDGTILIDPHRLPDGALTQIGDVAAILLTTSAHQRSSWFYRRELGAKVWAPAATKEAEEEPDERYSEEDTLPGGFEAVFAPGAGTTQHVLLRDGVLFVGDNLIRPRDGDVMLIPEEYAHDAAQNRETVREKLLRLEFGILCLSHGEPVTEDAHAAVRALLE